MREVTSASIVSINGLTPFEKKMAASLRQRNVQTEIIREQPNKLFSKHIDSDIIVLDIPSMSQSGSELFGISDFVLNNVAQKVFVSDAVSADILEKNLHGRRIEEKVWRQLMWYAVELASSHLRDLENVTQSWADSHIQTKGVFLPKSFELRHKQRLRYGENPHQKAAFYGTSEERYGVATARQVQGKQLSYNNINDTDAAYECVAEFDPRNSAAVAIIKHANPCGVSENDTLVDAYRKALACDPISAFGGIVAANRTLDANAARAMTEIFTEVIIAPDATEEALAIVGEKKNLRLLLAGGLPNPAESGLALKSVAGGMLVQTRDNAVIENMNLEVKTTRQPTNSEWRDLRFAFRVAKHVKSNAIVYAKDAATVGIGAGQMSRIDSAHIAARKAEEVATFAGLGAPQTKGSVVASDAFFPFKDGLEAAIEAGATAVIQPGGSVRDNEVIDKANEHGIAMVFTGVRHFRH
jgi:AICAR transformylase/IMP cyclohydrolase PurH